MVECKKHSATIPESTCIARHKGIAKARKSNNGWIKANALDYESCKDCKTGLKLYKNHLKGDKIMKNKVCTKCKEPKPADKKYFYGDQKSPDKLHNWCKVCHNKSCGKTPGEKTQNKTKISKNKHRTSEKIPGKHINRGKSGNGQKSEKILPIEKDFNKKILTSNDYEITLNFTDHKKLFNKIVKLSKTEMRDLSSQILYDLKYTLFAQR